MFWLVIAISAWSAAHSLLASAQLKLLLRRALGDGFMRFYRLLYNVIAIASIAPVLYLMDSLPDIKFPLPGAKSCLRDRRSPSSLC